MMLMGHQSSIPGIEILEINETDAAKKSALTTQCFSNKIRKTATNGVHLDASTLSAILLNPSRMLPSSSLLSITNEQTKGNINFNYSYCTNDYNKNSKNNNNNNTMYSNSSRSNDKSKVCHLHMQQNEDENPAYEQNAANFLYLKRQKGQKQPEKEEVEARRGENNNNNNNHHHGSSSRRCSSSSRIRLSHAKTKQLHWWWGTCFVVVICLSLPSTTNMQPQDFVSLPKSSKLSPSVSSRLSTSLSQTNSLLFTPIPITTTKTTPTTTTTVVTFQNITSGTSSASFMQSTAHSTVTKDYLLERQRLQQRQQSVRQQRQHLKLMTTLRSLHARKRRRRSMLTSHNDDSNGTTSRNANLSVNLDENNNNNSTHHFSNTNNNYIECPSYNENSACPCYKFEDGEHIIRIYCFGSQFI